MTPDASPFPAARHSLDSHRSYARAVAHWLDSEFRSYAKRGDDADVESAFEDLAAQAASDAQRFSVSGSSLTDAAVAASSRLPAMVQLTHRPEEQIVQRLIMAYAACGGMRALCSTIARCAHAAADSASFQHAREAEYAYDVLAGRIWAFLPTRSLIAFNVLTATEIDPAVETKTARL